MTLTKLALSGTAAIALAGALSTQALAFTHHPSTPAERRQTDQLNEQALQNARSGNNAGATTPASSNASSAGTYDNGTMGANGSSMNNGSSSPASVRGGANGSYDNGTMGTNGSAAPGSANAPASGATNSTNNGDTNDVNHSSGANTTPGATPAAKPSTPSGSERLFQPH
jgi:hypothetical protein